MYLVFNNVIEKIVQLYKYHGMNSFETKKARENAINNKDMQHFNCRSDDAAPNLSDSLFLKIFEKNKFEHIQASDF
jgi:hypothetical protein